MTTYPVRNQDGSLRGFEITSYGSTFGLVRLLRKVPGVTDVRRQWFNEDHIVFKFQGRDAVVHEPFGDNSRYWIGLQDPDRSSEFDITPLYEAFRRG